MKRSAALLLLAALPVLALADAPAERTLKTDVDPVALKNLVLRIGVGEVHVTVSRDSKVHAQVTLKQKQREFMWFFHWMSEGTAKDIAGANLRQTQQGDSLTLSLDYPGDTQGDDLKQDWEVQVPARLALTAEMKVGELNIEGVAGGVDARLDVGELSIDTPGGPIRADVNVGEVRATSGSTQLGEISLSSTIGEAVIIIGGKSAGMHEHGGLGNRVSLPGSGPDSMHLSVNVGEVSLHVTPATDSKGGI